MSSFKRVQWQRRNRIDCTRAERRVLLIQRGQSDSRLGGERGWHHLVDCSSLESRASHTCWFQKGPSIILDKMSAHAGSTHLYPGWAAWSSLLQHCNCHIHLLPINKWRGLPTIKLIRFSAFKSRARPISVLASPIPHHREDPSKSPKQSNFKHLHMDCSFSIWQRG